MEIKKAYKSFLGIYRKPIIEVFFLKMILFGTTAVFFLGKNLVAMCIILAITLACNLILLGRNAFKIVKFLLLSSVVLIIVWGVFVGRIWNQSDIKEALIAVYTSVDFKIAFLRLYGFFSVGQLFLGVTSQHELLSDLKKTKLPAMAIVTVVLMFNSIAYFISFYSDINKCYQMRCLKDNVFKKAYYIFSSLTFEALSMIVNCKKILFIDDNRIKNIVDKIHICHTENSSVDRLIIQLNNIIYHECDTPVISNLEASFDLGKINIIWGDNGVGKSTFFDTITGVIPNVIKADGSIQLNIDSDSKNIIGYVPQGVERSLMFDTPENMTKDIPDSEKKTWLKKFMLSHIDMETRNMNELSSGERKKIELISELLYDNHKIVLLDEPTAFLDEPSKEVLFELLTFVKKNKIILVITHDDYFKGKEVVWFHMLQTGMVNEPFFPNCERGIPAKENMLLFDNLDISKRVFRQTVQINNDMPNMLKLPVQSIVIESNKNIAILGKNGCGKTTLDKKVFDYLVQNKPRIKCLMMVQEVNKQFFAATIEEELFLGCSPDKRFRQFIYTLMEYVDLLKHKDMPAYFLSGGQKRLLLLLCLIAQSPDVIILDEPFEFIDVENRKKLIYILIEYQKRSGISYILSDQTLECFEDYIDETIIF